ncbi:MAG: serine/threonine protein kinase [Deltaproteobacteria bacterium]|nr:serine/threonine protein kinase [Deltaproteobacteria bacterium]
MECLDANVVQDLMAGALEAPARVVAIEHLDTCQDCRELIAMLAREATHEVAVDTLNDTEKRATGIAMMDTVGSDDGFAATVAPGSIADAMGDTVAPEQSINNPVRIRAPNQTGKTLGRYTIMERLGAGAMGVVYRAEDKELGRSVALKQLHRPDEALTGRLIREARSMAQVNHPNVVAVYDVGVADGTTYIAMELVTGESLRAWQTGRSVNELLEAYIAAGRGLAAAHDAGLIHRDFKPDNVLIGKDARARVTDFGLAASRPSDELLASQSVVVKPSRSMDDVNLTTSGSVLGTPAYMAPEQFQGGNVDARTDQFNFCVSLHEALYGHRPFAGKTFDELSNNCCEGKVKPAPAGSRISTALRAILLRGLSVKPGDRFPTMGNLLTELGRDRAKPWRRTSYVAAALAGVLALGVGSDLVVRSRVSASIRQSFTATAKQADRAVRLVADQFDAISNLVYLFPVMGDVSAHHDQADFGLGNAADDEKDLDDIHDRLVSADWRLARDFGGREHPSILAVADYKARLLYTSADPAAPRTDLSTLPWVKQALDAGAGNSTTLVRYDDPELVASRMVGTKPPDGLAMVFARTRSLGEAAKTQFFQIVEARVLLDQIRLDDTLLSIVAPDGTSVGDVPAALIAAAPREGQAEVDANGTTYEVQSRPLTGFGPTAIGSLVMAQRMDGVLQLFPHARAVFAVGALAMLGLALATALKARRITGARAD